MKSAAGRNQRAIAKVLAIVTLLTLLAPQFAAHIAMAGGSEKSKTVVVLYPDANDGRPGYVLVDRGIRSTFAADARTTVAVHSEYLDVSRFPNAGYQQKLAEFLRQRYADRKVDLVIAGLGSGLDFALQHREHAFPGVPIIYCGVDHREVSARKLPRDVIGVPINMDLAATLDVALQLHPKTQRVYVVTGKSKFDADWQAEARKAFKTYRDKLELIHLAGLPMPDLLKQTAALPENSIVYYVHVFEDGAGKIVVPAEVLSLLAENANAPIYGHVDTYVGRGIVGGRVFSFEATGQNAATLGLRILAGEKPEQIGAQRIADNRFIFDARQLRHWGVSQASLPPGSEVRHHEPTFWDLYRWHILGVVSLCIIEALLILGLLVQRASRNRAETALRQSQSELRELTGRLLLAQETERRRIARELHDDLNQKLALLAVELDMLGQKSSENLAQAAGRIQELSAKVKDLSSTVHDLSHQLHPAKLEQLGLVPAILGLCKDLSQSHELTITVKHHDVSEAIPDDVALCLYRVAQETLQNVIKHSAAQQAFVELIGSADSIRMRVVDDGKGFDAVLLGNGGLGLVSMRERLRLIRGAIAIESQLAAGTRIEVCVPLS